MQRLGQCRGVGQSGAQGDGENERWLSASMIRPVEGSASHKFVAGLCQCLVGLDPSQLVRVFVRPKNWCFAIKAVLKYKEGNQGVRWAPLSLRVQYLLYFPGSNGAILKGVLLTAEWQVIGLNSQGDLLNLPPFEGEAEKTNKSSRGFCFEENPKGNFPSDA